MIIASHCRPENSRGDYTPIHPWPDDCYVQWGDSGIVFVKTDMVSGIESLAGALAGDKECFEPAVEAIENSYTTAFFEVFPKNPDTFIRGEGKTVAEAETKAFEMFQRIVNCPGHEFERRGYTNGAGFCKHCGMFKGKAFEPTTLCCRCGTPTNYGVDTTGGFWCETCYPDMPEEVRPRWWRRRAGKAAKG